MGICNSLFLQSYAPLAAVRGGFSEIPLPPQTRGLPTIIASSKPRQLDLRQLRRFSR
jgi:hypothetical protein